MTEPDAELVARIQSGDAVAFDTLMRRHFRVAFLIAYAQLGNRADAEDVCQDAFLRCWERILDCRDPSRVGRWIASIVRNTARNRREYLAVRDAVPLDAALAGTGRRPDTDAERGELRIKLAAALRTLTSMQTSARRAAPDRPAHRRPGNDTPPGARASPPAQCT